jgi:pilus assembly protein CpaF
VIDIQLVVPGESPHTRSYAPGDYVIGRSFTADVRLRHQSVAKRHAELRVREHQTVMRDLGTADSVRRNGVVVSTTAPAKLGDTFTIGECELKVLNVSETVSGGSAAASLTLNAAIEAQTATRVYAVPMPQSTVELEQVQRLKERLQELVLRELDLFRRTALNTLSNADLRQEAQQAIEMLIDTASIELPPMLDRAVFIREMTAEIMGYGPIEPYLSDESVSEVMVNGPSNVYVERAGRLSHVAASFTNEASLMRVIERIVAPLGRRIDEGVPMVDARLPDGSRVNAIIPPLSLVGPILTIRKFSKRRFSMDRLVQIGALTEPMAEFLTICVRHRKNIIVSGGTGSGKTTLLNALSESIASDERIVTIEDAAELRLVQPHVLSLEARPANVEGRGEVTIRELVRNALRMRPDRIIVGECRGGEALDMLQAMNTGHDGSLTTGHANSPRDLLSRLEVMVLMAGMDLPVRAIREQIASAVDIVVQQTRFSDGRRRVTSIVEVDGMEGEVILTQPLFTFRQKGIAPDGEVLGEHTAFGQAPRFYEALEESGIALDRSIFGGALTHTSRSPAYGR